MKSRRCQTCFVSAFTLIHLAFVAACPLAGGEPAAIGRMIVAPKEVPGAVLHNPDMGWVLYENYPLDQHPHGSSTMLVVPNESFPEADAVALMFAWRDIETNNGAYDFSKVDKAYDYWTTRGKEIQLRMSSEPLMVAPFANPGAPAYVLDHLTPGEKQTRKIEGGKYRGAVVQTPFYRGRLGAFLKAV